VVEEVAEVKSEPVKVESKKGTIDAEEKPSNVSRKSGLFDSVKKKFTEIFEENDSEM
jgi:hypothetical protein